MRRCLFLDIFDAPPSLPEGGTGTLPWPAILLSVAANTQSNRQLLIASNKNNEMKLARTTVRTRFSLCWGLWAWQSQTGSSRRLRSTPPGCNVPGLLLSRLVTPPHLAVVASASAKKKYTQNLWQYRVLKHSRGQQFRLTLFSRDERRSALWR